MTALPSRFSTRVVLDVDHYVPMNGKFEADLLSWISARTKGMFEIAHAESPLRDCHIAAVSIEETHALKGVGQ